MGLFDWFFGVTEQAHETTQRFKLLDDYYKGKITRDELTKQSKELDKTDGGSDERT